MEKSLALTSKWSGAVLNLIQGCYYSKALTQGPSAFPHIVSVLPGPTPPVQVPGLAGASAAETEPLSHRALFLQAEEEEGAGGECLGQ